MYMGNRRSARRRSHLHNNIVGAPVLEACEPRLLMSSTIVVTTNSDVVNSLDGVISLREAMTQAISGDTIAFNIAGSTTINVGSALPVLNSGVTIDGTTQPGVIVNGSGAGAGVHGFTLTNSNNTIKGLTVRQFGGRGINASGGGGHLITGNSLLNNGDDGIAIIGLGVQVTNNTIANNLDDGILVSGANANNAVISGNYVHSNLDDGIVVAGSAATISNNTIVGNGPGGGGEGISIVGGTSHNVTGNRVGVVGTDTNSNLILDTFTVNGNGLAGITVTGSHNNTITGNIVSGNAFGTSDTGGIVVSSNGNTISGNFIGAVSGEFGVASGFGNKHEGIRIEAGFTGNQVTGNVIASNTRDGVRVFGPAVGNTANVLSQNLIYDNTGIGINLIAGATAVPPAVTANDALDADTGGNGLQNFPVITSASTNGVSTSVSGTLHSSPLTTFTVELFSSPAADGTGFGEGRVYLGSTTVTTDALGNGAFTATLAATTAGHVITATATSMTLSGLILVPVATSEFGAAVTIALANVAPAVTVNSTAVTVSEGAAAGNAGTFSDANLGDNVTFTASEGTVTKTGTSSGTWSWSKATTDDETPHTVTITASDGNGGTASVAFTLTVNNANPTLTVASNSVTITEGETATNSGAYGDPGTDIVSITASRGAVSYSAGVWNWSETVGDNTTGVVTITATDGEGGTTSVTFNLTVDNAEPTLTVNSASVAVTEGDTATNSGAFADVSADTVTITASQGAVTQTAGTWSWSQLAADDASGTVTITATDEDGGESTVTFTLTVANADPTLTVGNASVAVSEGATASNSGTFADVAADIVTITASEGTVSQSAGVWTWSKATTDDEASHLVTITATDEDGGVSTTTFSLTVTNANPTVTASNASVAVSEGTTATNSGTFADVAADTVIITASEGTVTQGAGTWSWSKATTDDEAAHTVTITATDDNGGVSTTTFTLTVANANPTVTAASASVSVAAGSTATNSGTFSDLGLDDIVTITASEGVITQTSGASGTWSWSKATTAAEATHTVTVTATDNNGGTATITFDLTVTPVVSAVGATVTADPANPGDTMLLVTSNATGHRIDVDLDANGALVVTIRSGSSTVFQQTFAGGVDRIVVEGGDGDDVLRVNSGVNVPVELYGGAGNDWLRGGSDNDYLDGGEGNDLMFGGDGRDILVGGDGFDVVTGNFDEDILIGGVYTGARAALAAVLAEWGSANSYTVRVDNLRNGGGLNGSFVLNSSTVFDDADMDILLGLQGRDWFLADGEDDHTDDHANEFLTDIEIDFINS